MIECSRITDYQLAAESLREQWDAVSEDSSVFKVPDIVNEFWIAVYDDGEYAGFFRVAALTSICYECHICIRPGYRRIKDYCLAAFSWVLVNVVDLKKLICNIPEYKAGVLSLAEQVGFVKQGQNHDSFMKNGTAHSLVQMGISRSHMEELCPPQYPH